MVYDASSPLLHSLPILSTASLTIYQIPDPITLFKNSSVVFYGKLQLITTFKLSRKAPSSHPLQFLASTSCGGFSQHRQIGCAIASWDGEHLFPLTQSQGRYSHGLVKHGLSVTSYFRVDTPFCQHLSPQTGWQPWPSHRNHSLVEELTIYISWCNEELVLSRFCWGLWSSM